MEVPDAVGLGRTANRSLAQPEHGEMRTTAPAFTAETRSQVDDFFRRAIAAGGKDNRPPGLRPHYHTDYYGAFVIGPDGHNVEVVCHRPEV